MDDRLTGSSTADGRALQRLLDEVGRLPGIGAKSAQRIAYHILTADAEEARRLAQAIIDVKEQVHFCSECFNYATRDHCDICDDPSRDRSVICVVAEPRDVAAIERTGSYHGLYHVLGGTVSPIDHISLDQLHATELFERLATGEVEEVIMATNLDTQGDYTAILLAKMIKPMGVAVSRLSQGMPKGGEVEYADEATLGGAIEDRRAM